MFRKIRTTKSVGRDIGIKINKIKQQEKILRTLQKEKEIREKENVLKEKIQKLKSERPTLFKELMKKGSKARKSFIKYSEQMQKQSKPIKQLPGIKRTKRKKKIPRTKRIKKIPGIKRTKKIRRIPTIQRQKELWESGGINEFAYI